MIALLLAGLTQVSLALSAPAAAPPKPDSTSATKPDTDKVKTALQAAFPKVPITDVNATEWPGLFEVVVNNDVIYTDADAKHLFVGKIIDTKTREDLTAKRVNELGTVDFKSLPFDLALKSVRGDGSRSFAIFADPDCPYCKRLEEEMKGIDNVTIYTFLYPLESLHPAARERAKKIWCAKDRNAAWNAWMLNKTEPANATCKTEPTQQLLALGEKLNVTGTPTLFFVDGHRVAGVMPHDQLEKELVATHITKK
jgi:thiol:disulfide interchange protein DsbC